MTEEWGIIRLPFPKLYATKRASNPVVVIQKVEPSSSYVIPAYEMHWPIIERFKTGSFFNHFGIGEFTGAKDHFCNRVLQGL
jgi:hypothetical protein